ncbi:MAG: hypothetical protein IPJ65_33560 [Archangiaceae bacterium]|nr:hypothetical protein [Archangiaceae bacterium]
MASPKRPPVWLLVIAAVLVAGIGAALWRHTRFNTVHAVNGLAVAVEVTLDGKTLQVPAQGRVEFEQVPTGTHVVTAKHGATELETTLIFVRGGRHTLVYNVGGTAPLVWERIAYTTRAVQQTPQWTMHCGKRFLELEGLDYVFENPPSSISTKGGGTVYRTWLSMESGGLEACQSWALDRGTQEMWAEWQRLTAQLDPKKALYAVDEYASQGDFREAQVLLEPLLAKKAFEVRSLYLSVLLASGQVEKARAAFGRADDDEGADDVDLYFAARLLSSPERLKFLDRALERFPQSSYLRFEKARALDRRGDTEAALPLFTLAEDGAPEALQWSLAQLHLSALLRGRHPAEAWSAAQTLYRDATSIDAAVSYANVAKATGHTAAWEAKLAPHQLRWAHALLGLPDVEARAKDGKPANDPESFKQARELIRATFESPRTAKGGPLPVPSAALSAAARAPDTALRLLPDSIVWLLLSEAWRSSDTAAAARLSRHAQGADAPALADAQQFIATGRLTVQLEGVSDVHLAVLWVARGRRLATLGEDPTAAFAEARRLDATRSVVTRALDSWAQARVGARLPWLPVD